MRSRIPMLLAAAALLSGAFPTDAFASGDGFTFRIKASANNARVNREVQGEVVDAIRGVPAAPVDSFVWDGEGSTRAFGVAFVDIDPVENSGRIRAYWFDRHGLWSYKQTAYAPPPHPTGLRLSSSATATENAADDPVTTNIYLHGDTNNGGPVLPTVPNLLATWGPASVKLNGEPFENVYDGPVPKWVGHSMITVGVREPDGTVRDTSGGIYNVMKAAEGARDEGDMEFHLVFHDAPGPSATPGNIPPDFSFFYHLVFENVRVNITQRD